MTVVKSLRVTLPGPMPEDLENATRALEIFFQTQFTELVLHYGEPESRLTHDEGIGHAVAAMYRLLLGRAIGPKHVTITWDCRDDKQDVMLKGYTS